MGVAALLDVWGRSWAGPERGSEILCVLSHGMGSTPPPPSSDRCGGQLGSVFISSDVGAIDVGGLKWRHIDTSPFQFNCGTASLG